MTFFIKRFFINDIFLFVESTNIVIMSIITLYLHLAKLLTKLPENFQIFVSRAACTNNQCLHKTSFQLLLIGLDVLLQSDYA